MASLHGEAIPILPARDVADTIVFYARMGFDTLRRYDGFGAAYLILRRDDVELHFVHSPGVDPRTNDRGCYLRVADAQAVYDEWAPTGMTGLHPISDTPWGMREFSVVDLSGNLIRVGTRLEP